MQVQTAVEAAKAKRAELIRIHDDVQISMLDMHCQQTIVNRTCHNLFFLTSYVITGRSKVWTLRMLLHRQFAILSDRQFFVFGNIHLFKVKDFPIDKWPIDLKNPFFGRNFPQENTKTSNRMAISQPFGAWDLEVGYDEEKNLDDNFCGLIR